MIHYILKNPDGSVFQRGVCGGENEIPQINGLTPEVIEMSDMRHPSTQVREPTYVDYRSLAYPSIGSQIDALWHAMDDGLLPKIEPMYSDIKSVKDKYPKPTT